MAKKKEHSEWLITKGRLSRHQREQKRRRLIIVIGSAIIAIVLVIVAIGIYQDFDNDRKPYQQKILKINDVSFDMDYYIEMLRVYGVIFQQDPIQRYSAGTIVLENIKGLEIGRQLASMLSITVTEEEIDTEILKRFNPPDPSDDEGENDNPEATPEPKDFQQFERWLDQTGASEKYYRERISAELLGPKIVDHARELVEVPEEMEQVHLYGILFDTAVESGTSAATTTISTSGSPAVIAPVTSGTDSASSTIETLGENKIRDAIATRLEEGEDFATLFEEYSLPFAGSEDGDLGWGPREIVTQYYSDVVTDVAFKIDLGILSTPIPATPFEGETLYYVIMVTEREDSRPLDDDIRTPMEQNAITDWYNEQTSNLEIDDYQDDPTDDKDIVLEYDDISWAIQEALDY